MSDKFRAYLYLHICVLFWGFTAVLGKLITLQALSLVWWRVLLTSAILWLLLPKAVLRNMNRAAVWQMALIGALVGVHWLCFYGAVKLSNASIAVTTMAATSLFSAIAEPVIMRRRVNWFELGLGLLILPGMALVAGNIDWSMQKGFGIGLVGALLAAVFSALNKRLVDKGPFSPLAISFVELFTAFLVCSIALPFAFAVQPGMRLLPTGYDWLWLLLLSGVCTVLPFSLSLLAMRHLSAFTANLTINLEPVYGVILAILIFREDKELGPGFYLGVLIILAAVLGHPFLKKVEKLRS